MCAAGWTRRDFIKTAGVTVGGTMAGATALFAAPEVAHAAPLPQGTKSNITLTNVRVFDGRSLSAPRSVVITNGVIGVSSVGTQKIDAKGAVLLPGLIDAHIHLQSIATLQQLTSYGVTTGLDMACWPASLVNSLRHQSGLTDIRSAGVPAVAPGSLQSQIPGFPASGVVSSPALAWSFVSQRVAEGSDYIKLIVDIPGLDQNTLNALVLAAHSFGKQVEAHATSFATVNEALQAGVDVVHHVPLDTPLTAAVAGKYASGNRTSVPTLGTMQAFANLGIPGLDYAAAQQSVAALHRAGIKILAGTDANATPGVPVHLPFGLSLHQELELLVQAGLSTVEALRSATVLTAGVFGLRDRGVIQPGYRADLILVDGDPIADIRATRNLERIWAGGIEYLPAA